MYICKYMCICIYIYIYMCVCVCVCVCVCMCVCVWCGAEADRVVVHGLYGGNAWCTCQFRSAINEGTCSWEETLKSKCLHRGSKWLVGLLAGAEETHGVHAGFDPQCRHLFLSVSDWRARSRGCTSQVISQCGARVKLNRVCFPRWLSQAHSLGSCSWTVLRIEVGAADRRSLWLEGWTEIDTSKSSGLEFLWLAGSLAGAHLSSHFTMSG